MTAGATPSRGRLLAVSGIALLAISTSGPMIVASGMDKPALGFWRVLIAGSIQLLIATAIERGALLAIKPRDLLLTCAAGGILGLHYFTWMLSLDYTSVTSSTVLATTNPLWVAIGAWAILREKTSPLTWLAIAIGIAGAVVLAVADAAPSGTDSQLRTISGAQLSNSRRALIGDALAILGALTSSATMLMARALRARIPAATYVGITSLAAAPVLLFTGFLFDSSFVPDSSRMAGLVLAVALVPHLIGNTSLTWLLGWMPAPRVALVILGEPVGATLLAWAFLDQTPRPLTFVGAALVLLAVGLSLRPTAPKPAA